MASTNKSSTVLGAIDNLLLRVGAALPSSDPQDMHAYATRAPSQQFLREILDVTQSVSNALVTMLPVSDSKIISLLKEHATHDQVVFEILSYHELKYGPRVPKWKYQSDENGQNTLTCAGSAVVLDLTFEKSVAGADHHSIRLVSLKSSYPTTSESAPVTQPPNTVEDLLGADITAYINEVTREGADATKAAQLAWRVMAHIRYIMLLDSQAAQEAKNGGTGARWFAEVGILSPKVIDLACQEAAGLASQLGAPKAPLDIFLRRAHAFPLINLNSPSISFLIGMTPISYLSLLKASTNHVEGPPSDPQPNIDIPNNLLRRFVAQHPTPPGITTCNLIVVSGNQSNSEPTHPTPPRIPYFPLLGVSSMPSQSHAFPLPDGDSSWVLDFGAKGLVMRRSAMQALVQALGHVGDIDVTLSGMGFMNLGMGLISGENPGWVSMLLQKRSRIITEHLYTTQTSPNRLYPPIHLTLRVPNEAGFVLGRVRVRNMAEVWTILEIVREQCWLNNTISSYVWEETPQHTDTLEAPGLENLLSGKFLSIPTQMNISTGSAPLSLLLQFPVPCKGGVPSVVQLMASYDPTAPRGTRIQFGALDSKLPVTETLGQFENQVDEVVRRAGPLAAVGWLHAQLKAKAFQAVQTALSGRQDVVNPARLLSNLDDDQTYVPFRSFIFIPYRRRTSKLMESRDSETLSEWPPSDEKAPRKAFSLAPDMLSVYFDHQGPRDEPASVTVEEVETRLLPDFSESHFETAARRPRTRENRDLKITSSPSRFTHIGNGWELSNWGSVSCLELTPGQMLQAHARINKPERQMGQFRSSSLSGNGIVGSAFYTFPAMAAVASIFSPISLLVACLIMTIYRPILLELGSAFRLNGTNYVYLLQSSGRTLAAIGATTTLIDAVAASVVSAAAAGAYVKGEFPEIPATDHTIGIYLLVLIALFALFTLRESGKLTLVITIIHMVVMAVLMVGSTIAWTHTGTDMIRHNWELRPTGAARIARSIYIGVCVGITGFECSPGYIKA
ncbi:amino acid permease [Rhizoctonia solani]|uniref:Amino acid permease n=1 Tax=Rhizoctonia solani TaxID=456999 RepID=A0A8H8P584_9AGAM|nr:amino acid permease [Rhizoctonia solani]QRW24141.1 amino acid permease [Rhizoctonia solani]